LGCDRRQCFGEWIVDLLGIGNHHSFAVAEDDVAGNTDDGGILRDISQHDGTSANPAVPAHGDIAENLGTAADHDVFFDGGMTFAVLLASAAESDALIQGHVVTDDGGLADDHAETMINEEPSADFGAGMDFDSGEEARHL